MSGNIFNLYYFNADLVPLHFSVPPDDLVTRAAMRFMYKITESEMLRDEGSPQSGHHIQIALATNQRLEMRYRLSQMHLDDFFQGQKIIDQDALSIVIVCGDQTMNIPLNPQPEYKATHHNNDNAPAAFPISLDGDRTKNLIRDARYIWQEAQNIQTYGYFSNPETFSRASLFIAHLNAFDYLLDYEPLLESGQKSPKENQHFLKGIIPHMKDFLCSDCTISHELKDYIDFMEVKTLRALTKSTPSARHGNHITLIPSP